MKAKTATFLVVAAILFDGGLCFCYCDDFDYFSWNFGSSINISLNGSTSLYIEIYFIEFYECQEAEILWEIVKPNGEYEVYTVANYSDYRHGRRESITQNNIAGRGLLFVAICYSYCDLLLIITPTDLRYNGAQITGIVRLPECFNTSNTTNTTTLRIQGLLKAPTDVSVEADGVGSINVSWSPPFTLEGVPILHYSVYIYITSQGVSEQRNTTETHISLERPCASTTYQISAWNEVGEGNATRKVFLTLIEAAVKVISKLPKPGICLFCSFFSDSTADGCTVKMENDKHVFLFNATRSNNNDDNLALLECFSVPEGGEYSVSVHEIHYGVLQEHVSTQVNNITVSITEGTSLKYSNVKPVSGGICAFCVFTNGSTAKGCAITLSSDQITFNFTIPRHSTYDIALQECFKVQQSGSYHVLVSEILMDGSEGYNTLELPDVTIALASATDKQENGTPTVTGLSIVLCLTLLGLILAVLLASILFLKKRSTTRRKNNVCTDSDCTGDPGPPAAVTTAPLYENTQLPHPPTSVTDGEDNMYEHVELRPITGQDKEIAVAPNAAYGTVRI